MTQEEKHDLIQICSGEPWFAAKRVLEYIQKAQDVKEEPKGTWTGSQRNAAWLYMTQKGEQLNDAGLDIRKVLKPTYNIPWTKDNFHDHLWIPIQKAMFSTESMRELKKEQLGRVHDVLERELGEKHGLEYVPFPTFNVRMEAMENLNNDNYPEYNGAPTI